MDDGKLWYVKYVTIKAHGPIRWAIKNGTLTAIGFNVPKFTTSQSIPFATVPPTVDIAYRAVCAQVARRRYEAYGGFFLQSSHPPAPTVGRCHFHEPHISRNKSCLLSFTMSYVARVPSIRGYSLNPVRIGSVGRSE